MSAPVDLGGVSVQVLRDAEASFATFEEAFPNASDEIEAVARRRDHELFDGDRWLLPFCAFLVRSRAQTVLVDAGVGPAPGEVLPERQGWLPTELRRAGVAPDDVDVVILTHLHVDHVGWAAVDGAPSFASARSAVSDADWRFAATRAESDEIFATKLAPLERAGRLTPKGVRHRRRRRSSDPTARPTSRLRVRRGCGRSRGDARERLARACERRRRRRRRPLPRRPGTSHRVRPRVRLGRNRHLTALAANGLLRN